MKAAAMTKAQTRRYRWAVLLRVLMVVQLSPKQTTR